MPPNSKPVYLGRTTARMLDAAPPEAVGVLVKAILAWALRDELPDALPPDLAPFWAVIEDESNTMHDLRDERAEAGRRSGEARRNKREQAANKNEQTRTNANKPEQTEKETETEKSPASAGDARAREGAFEPCEDCPAPEDRVRVTARHIGMPDAELSAWRDYWTMREWRADPRSPRPMTPAGVLASLRRWHNEEGIRAAKQAHLDAKADERALAVAAARDERRAPAGTDYDAIKRAKELAWARSPVVNLDELDKFAGTSQKEA